MNPFSKTFLFLFFNVLLLITACKKDGGDTPKPTPDKLQITAARVGILNLQSNQTTENIEVGKPIVINFTHAIQLSSVLGGNFQLQSLAGEAIELTYFFLDNNKTISAQPKQELQTFTDYQVILNDKLKGENNETFDGITYNFKTLRPDLELQSITLNGADFNVNGRIIDIPQENIDIQFTFSHEVELASLKDKIRLIGGSHNVPLDLTTVETIPHTFKVNNLETLQHITAYKFFIFQSLASIEGNDFGGFDKEFYTAIDTTPKFPLISDEELLTLVQQQTFKYFWDFGHPVSGLTRERNTSGNTVTTGGSGFGLMAIVVGIERGFITRQEGIDRLEKIVNFLAQADRFHGVWSHWLHGSTGKVIPFSTNDDGGDLVETSFLAMGLLTVRQYLSDQNTQENTLKNDINQLWENIEWNWHTKGGENALYWHWSPNFAWEKNHKISGYNEALITYILAASSPTHSIDIEAYKQGWARNGNMQNGNLSYGITLPLGNNNLGGPLFFEQYTYLGINPQNLSDTYANYWEQTANHTLINRAYCIDNPKNYVGYGESCWGLTASDGNTGYSAHSPTNDRGVITPTAALSSFPYTPEKSMQALHHFYYVLGDKLWGQYGFYDAFNLTEGWYASSYLAIDQGPIVGMIENYRTGLLWDLFMSCPEVQNGLNKLGFNY
ncbi:MAG: glucoamylase family protein [Chitinophagales bacterium]